MFTDEPLVSRGIQAASREPDTETMDKIPPHVSLCMGLFSGICMSAAWCAVRPFDVIGAVCVGTASCALLLIVLRFDRVLIRKQRRRTDAIDPAFETA